MCSDYEKNSLVQPVYVNDNLSPRVVPETHPLLQDWKVTGAIAQPVLPQECLTSNSN